MKKRVILFAGAGASVAVNAKNYPTAAGFLQVLPPCVRENDTFGYVLKFLESQIGMDRSLDIEQVLWALGEIKSNYTRITSETSLEGFLARTSMQSDLVDSRERALSGLSEVNREIIRLTGNINEHIYAVYSKSPTQDEVDRNWILLLDKLDRLDCTIEIVTTNYDLILDTVLINLRGKLRNNSLGTGYTADAERRLALEKFSGRGGQLLVKLHGAVNWIRNARGEISVGSPIYTGRHENHAIIYPGFKGEPTYDPFVTLHRYFAEQLRSADAVVVIGFAFRDDYINTIFKECVPRNALKLVVNPMNVGKTPFVGTIAENLQMKFDSDAVDVIAHRIARL